MIHKYKTQLEAALVYSGGTHTFGDVVAMVDNDEAQLWTEGESALVTTLVRQPQFKQLYMFLAGGQMKDIEVLTERALAWGRDQGCTRAAFVGRRGWERSFLARTGWRTHRVVVMEKALWDGQQQ